MGQVFFKFNSHKPNINLSPKWSVNRFFSGKKCVLSLTNFFGFCLLFNLTTILNTILQIRRLNSALRHHLFLTPNQDQVIMSIYKGYCFVEFVYTTCLFFQLIYSINWFSIDIPLLKYSAEEYMELKNKCSTIISINVNIVSHINNGKSS